MEISLITWILKNRVLICGILCLMFWSFFCYNIGSTRVQNKWDKAVIEATIKARQIENDNSILNNIIGGKYENKLTAIDTSFSNAINRLQSTSSSLPSTTITSSKSNGTTCSNRLSESISRKLIFLAREADKNTAKLISLQEYNKGVK